MVQSYNFPSKNHTKGCINFRQSASGWSKILARKKRKAYLCIVIKHKNMRRTVFIFFSFHFSFFTSTAQTWTMQQCMQYAVEHNHDVKRTELELDNYKAQKTGAIGSCHTLMLALVPNTTSDVPSTLRPTPTPMSALFIMAIRCRHRCLCSMGSTVCMHSRLPRPVC